MTRPVTELTIEPNPVLRSGAVLRAKDGVGLAPAQSVRVARILFERADIINDRFRDEVASSIPFLTPIFNDDLQIAPSRLRFSPILTMDFAPTRFDWDGSTIETRAVVTICAGDTRGKLWLRLGFLGEANPNVAASQKEKLFDVAEPLKALWIKYYNEICELNGFSGFRPVYDLSVFMLSSNGSGSGRVRDLLSSYSLAAEEGGLTRGAALNALKQEFAGVADLDIREANFKSDRHKVVAYSFPRHEVVGGNDRLPIETIADQDLKALCTIEFGDERMDVFGISVEPEFAPKYTRSASYITSAEISYELGRLF